MVEVGQERIALAVLELQGLVVHRVGRRQNAIAKSIFGDLERELGEEKLRAGKTKQKEERRVSA